MKKFLARFKEISETLIKVKCAWYGKDMGTKEGNVSPEFKNPVSHGMCDTCQVNWQKDLEKKKKEMKK